jgi:hypothetical protein
MIRVNNKMFTHKRREDFETALVVKTKSDREYSVELQILIDFKRREYSLICRNRE